MRSITSWSSINDAHFLLAPGKQERVSLPHLVDQFAPLGRGDASGLVFRMVPTIPAKNLPKARSLHCSGNAEPGLRHAIAQRRPPRFSQPSGPIHSVRIAWKPSAQAGESGRKR